MTTGTGVDEFLPSSIPSSGSFVRRSYIYMLARPEFLPGGGTSKDAKRWSAEPEGKGRGGEGGNLPYCLFFSLSLSSAGALATVPSTLTRFRESLKLGKDC